MGFGESLSRWLRGDQAKPMPPVNATEQTPKAPVTPVEGHQNVWRRPAAEIAAQKASMNKSPESGEGKKAA